ncbi:hypothetical protein G7Y79_00002g006810 [Physcia stellaris]|nr:hypothetical protein G7Y79_00002g006810 [Physcia stellaris]
MATSTAQTPTLSPSPSTSPIYFWREYNSPYDFLSQWYHSPFTAPTTPCFSPRPPSSQPEKKTTFQTTEQYMMYRKATLFGDEEIAVQILREPEPKRQKALGRKVRGFEEGRWDEWREGIVEEGNWYKFTAAKEATIGGEGKAGRTFTEKPSSLGKKLLQTGERELVEASPYDRIWGIGYGAAKADANRESWGENLLGKALMRVRERLRREIENED